jgi:hypothetical protein
MALFGSPTWAPRSPTRPRSGHEIMQLLTTWATGAGLDGQWNCQVE